MKIKITVPALELRVFSKAKKQYIIKPFIGGYVSSLRKKRGSGRAEKRDAWYAHAHRYIHSYLACNCLLPKEPHDEKGWRVSIETFFYNGTHMDGTNVLKGIEDILVGKVKGVGRFFLKDDKMIGGSYEPPQYDKENPRIELTIERIEG